MYWRIIYAPMGPLLTAISGSSKNSGSRSGDGSRGGEGDGSGDGAFFFPAVIPEVSFPFFSIKVGFTGSGDEGASDNPDESESSMLICQRNGGGQVKRWKWQKRRKVVGCG